MDVRASLIALVLLGFFLTSPAAMAQTAEPASGTSPLRIGVAGLVHGHVHGALRQMDQEDIEIVGIYEPDSVLARTYAERYGFPMDLVYGDLEAMLEDVQPEAVTAFTSTYDHLAVVEACAPRGVHVMVEKPLAVSLEDALAMQNLAQEHGIHLLTNYETTWYASVHEAYEQVQEGRVGDLRRIIAHDGHEGPREIGVGPEFLSWLTDPVLNGGGALMDFGCYGANLMTWLMDGAPPTSVTAVTQQIKPDVYPDVDDEATILLTYPKAQGIIQASWNWPFSRKSMEVYGRTGYLLAPDGQHLRLRFDGDAAETARTSEPRPAPLNDPFAYLAAVVRGEVTVEDADLSALANNVTVVRILDAAKRSAETGETVVLDTP